MNKETFEKVLKKIKKKDKLVVDMTYEEYISYINIMKKKVGYTDVYKKSEENEFLFTLTEIATIIWGFYAILTGNFININDEDDTVKVFHFLSTQISNNLLALLNLCNKALCMQSGILIRSTIEMCYTLLVVLDNKYKRSKFIEAGNSDNPSKIWNEEFKFSYLNEEMKKFEKKISNNNYWLKKKLNSYRKSIYKDYSEYIHNSYLICVASSYEVTEDDIHYVIWGDESGRVKNYLSTICELNFFVFLELFKYFTKNTKIKDSIPQDEECHKIWDHMGYLYFIYKEYYLERYIKL